MFLSQAPCTDDVLAQEGCEAKRLERGRDRGGRSPDPEAVPAGEGAVPLQGALQDLWALLPHELPLQGLPRSDDVHGPRDPQVSRGRLSLPPRETALVLALFLALLGWLKTVERRRKQAAFACLEKLQALALACSWYATIQGIAWSNDSCALK